MTAKSTKLQLDSCEETVSKMAMHINNVMTLAIAVLQRYGGTINLTPDEIEKATQLRMNHFELPNGHIELATAPLHEDQNGQS